MLKNLSKGDIVYINNKPNQVIELITNILRVSTSKGEFHIRIHNINQNRSTGEFRGQIVRVEKRSE